MPSANSAAKNQHTSAKAGQLVATTEVNGRTTKNNLPSTLLPSISKPFPRAYVGGVREQYNRQKNCSSVSREEKIQPANWQMGKK